MTNNDIFKKLRVALKFRDDDIITVLELVDFKISKSELGAFFRKEDHPNYMECGDQVLRNFLNGLVLYLRGSKENPKIPGEVLLAAQQPIQRTDKNIGNKHTPKKKFQNEITPVKYKNKKKS